jgi:Icc-related predicted phosphoesterase
LAETFRNETSNSNIHVLEQSAVEIEGVTFIGCTLWTSFLDARDPSAAMETAQMLINDYRLIRHDTDNQLLRAQDTARIHTESVAWLRDRLNQCDPTRTVVVTHYAPSFQSEAPEYFNGPLSPAFASNLDSLIEQSGVALWVHGHTHHNVDYQIGSTRVVSNQRGYAVAGCKGFDPSLVIEV